MKNLQEEIFLKVWDIEAYNEVFRKIQTENSQRCESIFSDVFNKFEETLDDEQKEIFHIIYDLFSHLELYNRDECTAAGIIIGRELQKFIDDPVTGLRALDDGGKTFDEKHEKDIERLNAYFKAHGVKPLPKREG